MYARGATEGTGELFAGFCIFLVMKGGQLATTTDPDKLTQIMSETILIRKYMGAFRDKIPTPNLYESDISGVEDKLENSRLVQRDTTPHPCQWRHLQRVFRFYLKAGKAAKD